MTLQRSIFSAVLALSALVTAAPGAASQITIATDQPSYEVNQLISFTVDGPPGTPIFVLVDLAPGPVTIPSLGTFGIGFSSQFFMVPLGPIPPSGQISLAEKLFCRTAETYGDEFYLQAVGIINGEKVLSNPHHFAHMSGDCDGICDPPVLELGFQTTFADAPATGMLHIDCYKSVGQNDLFGMIDIPLDLTTQAVGALSPVISNASGSVVVQWIDWVDGDLTLRFFIDATKSVGQFNGPNALLTVDYAGETRVEPIHTSCSLPLDVGMAFGEFTVIKMVDGD